jgi:hypothetical protein
VRLCIQELNEVGDCAHAPVMRIRSDVGKAAATPLRDLLRDIVQLLGVNVQILLQTVERTERNGSAQILLQLLVNCANDLRVEVPVIQRADESANRLFASLNGQPPQTSLLPKHKNTAESKQGSDYEQYVEKGAHVGGGLRPL